MRHLIEDCQRKHLLLYACFIDFAKAYDSLPRHLLWHVTCSIGVHEQVVKAVQSMYISVKCQVNVAGALGPCFESCKGVKQGCPLSPTLLGIFLDRFYFMLMHRTQGRVGPALRSGKRVPALFYADDGLMMTTEPEGMHECCACLDVFCSRTHMPVNMQPGKTEMMLFGVSDARSQALQQQHQSSVDGQVVRYVAQYRYLGCHVHERWLYGIDFKLSASQALVQTLMLRRDLDHLSAARSVHLGLRMYDVRVRPSATYGSCVWATQFHSVNPASASVRNSLEQRHLEIVHGWCPLRGTEPTWLVYKEPGRLPLHYFWWRDILRFTNALSRLPNGSTWKAMLHDLCQSDREGRKCWAWELGKFLRNIRSEYCSRGQQAFVDEYAALSSLCKAYDSVWDGLCRHPWQARDRTMMAAYFAWFDSGSWLRRPRYLFPDRSASTICTCLRFRLSMHNLQGEGCLLQHADGLGHHLS